MDSIRQYLTAEQRESLQRARDTYGSARQILVSNEELCELAAVCAKYPRYDDEGKAREELHSKAIDEVADVLIILDHIISIFDLSDKEILNRIQGKVDRLDRWLAESPSMEQTTVDREVIVTAISMRKGKTAVQHCVGCKHVGNFQNMVPGGRCWNCVQHEWNGWEPKEGNK